MLALAAKFVLANFNPVFRNHLVLFRDGKFVALNCDGRSGLQNLEHHQGYACSVNTSKEEEEEAGSLFNHNVSFCISKHVKYRSGCGRFEVVGRYLLRS